MEVKNNLKKQFSQTLSLYVLWSVKSEVTQNIDAALFSAEAVKKTRKFFLSINNNKKNFKILLEELFKKLLFIEDALN